jgi:hypothetical protein
MVGVWGGEREAVKSVVRRRKEAVLVRTARGSAFSVGREPIQVEEGQRDVAFVMPAAI